MKGKHLAQEPEKKKERTKVQTKITHENAKSTMGSSKRRKTSNLGPKPITSSMQQVVQRDE
jgi:hypothetical protein